MTNCAQSRCDPDCLLGPVPKLVIILTEILNNQKDFICIIFTLVFRQHHCAICLKKMFVLMVILLKTLIGARCCNLLKPFKLIKFLVN